MDWHFFLPFKYASEKLAELGGQQIILSTEIVIIGLLLYKYYARMPRNAHNMLRCQYASVQRKQTVVQGSSLPVPRSSGSRDPNDNSALTKAGKQAICVCLRCKLTRACIGARDTGNSLPPIGLWCARYVWWARVDWFLLRRWISSLRIDAELNWNIACRETWLQRGRR